ncbi:MAG: phosphotransferase [Planctomycetaceae bacterium]|jgi:Ser/Thr protein kinase RdoA (MazF antagonist)|nr:phosphotransferase [Planctomycetaceae bacterium]
MITGQIVEHVLSAYPKDFRSEGLFPLDPSLSLGRCQHWRVESLKETFCLRRWPQGKPPRNHLQFIQAVLWTAAYEGIEFVPLPLETKKHKGFVEFDGSYWELLPWFDNLEAETETEYFEQKQFRVVAAMMSLAQFHLVVSGFPLPDPPVSTSLQIKSQLTRWKDWIATRLTILNQVLLSSRSNPSTLEEARLAKLGLTFLSLILPLSDRCQSLLTHAAWLTVPVQPVIGNALWRHLRFDRNGVCGMIDFKEVTVDNVSLDIASLLGSAAVSDRSLWTLGLNAYQNIRPLSDDELFMVQIFEQTLVLLEGLQYLASLFLEERSWTTLQQQEIIRRLEFCILRLEQRSEQQKNNRIIA